MNHNILKHKLSIFEIGSADDDFSFTQRLARENGWSIDFANQVVIEYKRFIYLVAISKHEVTPSDQVDQAWHLHMTYTRSYWVDLCKNILGFELHHNPTKGGREEGVKFNRQYSETLELYNHTFNEIPPESIWPQVEARFNLSDNFIRINKANHWVFRQPNFSFKQLMFFLILPIVLISCGADANGGDIWFWLKVGFGVFIAYYVIKWLFEGGNGPGGGGGCSSVGGGCGGSGCGGGD
ncbi:hypothetical protein MNBD_GAMMA07-948 [hydrothermal vent metagenome]|uniref:Uncharacterized protein n=1 Tax=hydrothermal vent metagenome TaxID=652676 RepID=A0A3B0XJ71_9ZZZZ